MKVVRGFGRRRLPAGFTLVEVLIALTLSTFVLLGLTAGLAAFADTMERVDVRTERIESMRTVTSVLAQIAASVVPVHERDALVAGRPVALFFAGSADRLRFVGVMPARHGFGGAHELSLRVDPAKRVLLLEMAPFLGDGHGFQQVSATLVELQNQIDGFQLAYQFRDDEPWLDRWIDPDRLPARIRIRVSASGQRWPDLIVPLDQVDAAASRTSEQGAR